MTVAIQGDLGGISSFDIHGDPTTVGARWKKWRRSFELFACGKGVTNARQKKALLLHCGGTQMQDVYFTFPPARQPGEGETVYTVAIEQLDRYSTTGATPAELLMKRRLRTRLSLVKPDLMSPRD